MEVTMEEIGTNTIAFNISNLVTSGNFYHIFTGIIFNWYFSLQSHINYLNDLKVWLSFKMTTYIFCADVTHPISKEIFQTVT